MGTATYARYHHRERVVPLPPIPEHTSCDWPAQYVVVAQGQRKQQRKRMMQVRHDNSLVNKERSRHGLLPLKRSRFLENMALAQATVMASKCAVEHSARTIQQLQGMLRSQSVGENVQSGASMEAMHACMSDVLLQNVLGDFHEYGVATAKGSDDKVYLCQLFRTAK
jgi:uncharacterized protein YkwD